MMFFKIGFRNAIRNRRRTLIASFAIGVGLFATVFTDAFMAGFEKNLVDSITGNFFGHIQVHGKNYREESDSSIIIKNRAQLISNLNKHSRINKISERAYSFGMIASPYSNKNVMISGVNFETENLEKHILESNKSALPDNYLMIGSRLAKDLDLRVDEKVIVTLAEAKSGELSQEQFRVSSIFEIGDKEVDSSTIFIPLNRLQKMLKIGNSIHEISIELDSNEDSLEFSKTLNPLDNELLHWTELAPDVANMLDLSFLSILIMSFFITAICSFGIMNVIFMSIYERLYEFGVLKSIGTEPKQIIKIILSESFILAVFGVLFGALLVSIVGVPLSIYGINYSEIEVGSSVLLEPIRPLFSFRQFIYYPCLTALFTIIISLYPAWWIAKLSPKDAMHMSS